MLCREGLGVGSGGMRLVFGALISGACYVGRLTAAGQLFIIRKMNKGRRGRWTPLSSLGAIESGPLCRKVVDREGGSQSPETRETLVLPGSPIARSV